MVTLLVAFFFLLCVDCVSRLLCASRPTDWPRHVFPLYSFHSRTVCYQKYQKVIRNSQFLYVINKLQHTDHTNGASSNSSLKPCTQLATQPPRHRNAHARSRTSQDPRPTARLAVTVSRHTSSLPPLARTSFPMPERTQRNVYCGYRFILRCVYSDFGSSTAGSLYENVFPYPSATPRVHSIARNARMVRLVCRYHHRAGATMFMRAASSVGAM